MATLHYRCTPSEQRLRGEKTEGRSITLSLDYFVLLDWKDLIEKRKLTHPSLNPSVKSWEKEKLQNAKPFHHRHLFWYDDEWSRSRGPPWSDPSARPRKRERFRFYRFWVSSSFPSTYSHIPVSERDFLSLLGPEQLQCWGYGASVSEDVRKRFIGYRSGLAGWLVCVTAFLRIVPRKKNPYRVRR